MWKRILIVTAVVGCLAVGFAFLRFGKPGFVIVPTGGMSNTIQPGEQLLTSSRLGTIHRGDLIVFRYPKDQKFNFVSRVIALAGESVQLVGTQVLVNGQPLPERRVSSRKIGTRLPLKEVGVDGSGPYTVYYDADTSSREVLLDEETYGVSQPYTVPADACFVLGDNRDDSKDSRYWGPVPLGNIVSRPVLVYANESGDMSRFFKRLK